MKKHGFSQSGALKKQKLSMIDKCAGGHVQVVEEKILKVISLPPELKACKLESVQKGSQTIQASIFGKDETVSKTFPTVKLALDWLHERVHQFPEKSLVPAQPLENGTLAPDIPDLKAKGPDGPLEVVTAEFLSSQAVEKVEVPMSTIRLHKGSLICWQILHLLIQMQRQCFWARRPGMAAFIARTWCIQWNTRLTIWWSIHQSPSSVNSTNLRHAGLSLLLVERHVPILPRQLWGCLVDPARTLWRWHWMLRRWCPRIVCFSGSWMETMAATPFLWSMWQSLMMSQKDSPTTFAWWRTLECQNFSEPLQKSWQPSWSILWAGKWNHEALVPKPCTVWLRCLQMVTVVGMPSWPAVIWGDSWPFQGKAPGLQTICPSWMMRQLLPRNCTRRFARRLPQNAGIHRMQLGLGRWSRTHALHRQTWSGSVKPLAFAFAAHAVLRQSFLKRGCSKFQLHTGLLIYIYIHIYL